MVEVVDRCGIRREQPGALALGQRAQRLKSTVQHALQRRLRGTRRRVCGEQQSADEQRRRKQQRRPIPVCLKWQRGALQLCCAQRLGRRGPHRHGRGEAVEGLDVVQPVRRHIECLAGGELGDERCAHRVGGQRRGQRRLAVARVARWVQRVLVVRLGRPEVEALAAVELHEEVVLGV
eukprot:7384254-Prymnesium_polylepis.2